MSNKILFVFEGEKTEVNIHKSINKEFFAPRGQEIETVVLPYGNNIYHLYAAIKDDEFLDLVELLREIEKVSDKLKGVSRSDISEVFLFFDHDAHDTSWSDNKMREMLEFFNNETDNGKLYISYPMVEAFRDFSDDFSFCSKNCVFQVKNNRNYKDISGKRAFLSDYKRFSNQVWMRITVATYMKAACLLFDQYRRVEISELPAVNQINIFDKQSIRHSLYGDVMILTAFPFFLVDYFGGAMYSMCLRFVDSEINT